MQPIVEYILRNDAKEPVLGSEGAAGWDVFANRIDWHEDGSFTIHSDVSVAIPCGFVGLLFPRSSITKTDLVVDFTQEITNYHVLQYFSPMIQGAILQNKIGVIDSDFRGFFTGKFKTIEPGRKKYEVGDRFAQLVIVPIAANCKALFKRVETLSETARGEGGYGSTGN